MNRSYLVWILLLLLAGCGAKDSFVWPATVGSWKLADTPSQGIAVYHGSGTIQVNLIVTPAAFEMLQKWRPQKGRMAFYRDQYFFTAESQDADSDALNRFVTEFEKSLTK